jgi:hypothetical protein
MNRGQFAPRYYTGNRVSPFAPPGQFGHMGHFGPGMCRSCGQPSDKCCCGCRECRKEAKELVVEARGAAGTTGVAGAATHTQNLKMETFVAEAMSHPILTRADNATAAAAAAAPAPAVGTAKAFIGGGCCVHLSVEYAPVTPTSPSIVLILVTDTEGTLLAWGKLEPAGVHYQVKENVVTTKPGATVTVFVFNAIARVRWCEVFSCC